MKMQVIVPNEDSCHGMQVAIMTICDDMVLSLPGHSIIVAWNPEEVWKRLQ